MFARVTTLQGSGQSLDQARTAVQQQVLPAVRNMEGFRGLLSLSDPSSGKAITLTLWESEAAMRQSEEAANQLRATTAATTGGQIMNVERYEVVTDAITTGTI